MTRLQMIRYSIWGAAAIVLLVAAVVFWSSSQTSQSDPAVVTIGGPFTLVDHTGAVVTEDILNGHPSLLFFGFTHCPDVCPTALGEATAWLDELGPDAEDLAVYFVTVDPERDTQDAMATYLTAFHPAIVGLTGSTEAVHQMLDEFHVYYRSVPLENGGYTMDHTASFYLLDDDAYFIGTIGTLDGPDAAIAKLRAAITG